MELKEAVIIKIKEISECLYKGGTVQGIASMQSLIPDLSSYLSDECTEEMRRHILQDALIPAMQAMQEEDGTALADVLQYELLPVIEES